ncbi:universal stress protein [Micromonospora endophytica]|uniref:Universal stress protein UspA n=1 Tax=Micromonospora endophytica TaxID=515350 RepID=A0A2W2CLK3_9ACTN|nr:universal stress protein [Micromonospora endophytica]PZF88997.1 universal stress protein UspA [Micromonospora endophytica]RIW41247.1 universal stress protein [Micromonospora endophytica]BCJ57647.1 universal stress protein [Micromonospora endophytica]
MSDIVVGYDGSPDAAAALDWALEQARWDGRPVRLAYVFEWLTVAGWIGPGVTPGMWPDERARQQVEELVGKAAADAAATHPDLTVRGEVLDGPPALVLEECSAQADLLVLGGRGHGGFAGLLAGSTAVSVTAHAHCPVVVVRRDTAGGARSGHVAVGVDGSEHSLLALGFAVEQAALRRVPLHVVRAWQPSQEQWHLTGEQARDAALADQRAELDEALRRWQESFPDVEVTVETAAAAPAGLLIDASRNAQLMVVGTRGRGGLRGMLLGSVSQQLIQHAHCPLAVIHKR